MRGGCNIRRLEQNTASIQEEVAVICWGSSPSERASDIADLSGFWLIFSGRIGDLYLKWWLLVYLGRPHWEFWMLPAAAPKGVAVSLHLSMMAPVLRTLDNRVGPFTVTMQPVAWKSPTLPGILRIPLRGSACASQGGTPRNAQKRMGHGRGAKWENLPVG